MHFNVELAAINKRVRTDFVKERKGEPMRADDKKVGERKAKEAMCVAVAESCRDPSTHAIEEPLLYRAVSWGNSDLVSKLLEIGVYVDEVQVSDYARWTPLISAAASGHEDFVGILLAAGAAVNKADKSGQTPLHLAAHHGHEAIVDRLLAAGAAVDKANHDGQTPLHKAALLGHEATVGRLIKALSTLDEEKRLEAVNQADVYGKTPLHRAALRGHEAVVGRLIEGGAYIIEKNQDGSAIGLSLFLSEDKSKSSKILTAAAIKNLDYEKIYNTYQSKRAEERQKSFFNPKVIKHGDLRKQLKQNIQEACPGAGREADENAQQVRARFNEVMAILNDKTKTDPDAVRFVFELANQIKNEYPLSPVLSDINRSIVYRNFYLSEDVRMLRSSNISADQLAELAAAKGGGNAQARGASSADEGGGAAAAPAAADAPVPRARPATAAAATDDASAAAHSPGGARLGR